MSDWLYSTLVIKCSACVCHSVCMCMCVTNSGARDVLLQSVSRGVKWITTGSTLTSPPHSPTIVTARSRVSLHAQHNTHNITHCMSYSYNVCLNTGSSLRFIIVMTSSNESKHMHMQYNAVMQCHLPTVRLTQSAAVYPLSGRFRTHRECRETTVLLVIVICGWRVSGCEGLLYIPSRLSVNLFSSYLPGAMCRVIACNTNSTYN